MHHAYERLPTSPGMFRFCSRFLFEQTKLLWALSTHVPPSCWPRDPRCYNQCAVWVVVLPRFPQALSCHSNLVSDPVLLRSPLLCSAWVMPYSPLPPGKCLIYWPYRRPIYRTTFTLLEPSREKVCIFIKHQSAEKKKGGIEGLLYELLRLKSFSYYLSFPSSIPFSPLSFSFLVKF